MVTTFSCPVCRTALMFAAPRARLPCPFCGIALQFQDDRVPVGAKVRCRKCQGVFTATEPPSVPAPMLEPLPPDAGACPLCGVLLKLPAHVPAGKTIRCPHCRGKFPPTAAVPPAAAPIAESSEISAAAPLPMDTPPPAVSPLAATKSAPKTQLAIKKSSRSKTQLAPAAVLPTASADALVTEPDDEDVLSVPPPATALGPGDPPRREPAPLDDTHPVVQPPVEPKTEPAPKPAPPSPPRKQAPGRTAAQQKPAKPRPEPERKPAQAPASKSAGTALAEPPEPTVAEPISTATAKTEAPKPYRPPLSMAPAAPRQVSAAAGAGLLWAKRLLITTAIAGVLYAGYSYFPKGLLGTRRTCYATEGSVYYNGKPAEGALVTLFPDDNKSRDRYFPSGKVGADGTFKLTTYEAGDGAPAGKYKVTISRGQLDAAEYEELRKKMSPQDIAQLMKKRARDPLYDKYNEPRNSGLTAEIATEPLNKLARFELR